MLVIGVIELVVGGLTSDSSFEFYLLAWATCTSGLWFMFEKAERAISDSTRQRVSLVLRTFDLKKGIQSIPGHFAFVFDRVFGRRHWSRRCFYRSALASIVCSAVVLVLFLAFGVGGWTIGLTVDLPIPVSKVWFRIWGPWIEWRSADGMSYRGMPVVGFFSTAVVLNVLPDYLSLLETRWAIRWMERGKGLVKLGAFDLAATTTISLVSIWLIVAMIDSPSSFNPIDAMSGRSYYSPFFFTTFFTSVWLWLYGLSELASRLLIRMNSGVGFLLSATDIEKQPLRAVGFVSVLLVSGIFVLLLPLVLF